MKNDKKTDDKINEKKDDKKSDDKGEEKKGKLEKVADGLKSTEKIVDAGGSVITKVIGFVDGIIHRDEKKKKEEEQNEQIQSLKDEIEKLREQRDFGNIEALKNQLDKDYIEFKRHIS